MKVFTKSVLVVAALALAACDRNGQFDNPSGGPSDYFNSDTTGIAAADPQSTEYFQQMVGDRVLFAVDEYTLGSDARSALNAQAEWLISNPGFSAIVEGHADERGTREYNLALGDRRANSARDYLISRGVTSNRVKTVSYGKERPAQLCSDESCYSQNRRAVTVLVAGF
jgi:peptidoglycan-associated lipoprotein